MLPSERRATWSLSLIYMVRMLGLFIILPVFSLFAGDYEHSSPFLIGLAIGIYGLLQALLQIPIGTLSDRIGRKILITIGLLMLAVGSVVAATADSIFWVILGRALQGAGAISAVIMALAADLTRDEQRTKVMATLGASIGLSFIVALILGPVLIGWFSFSVLFWFTAICALLAIVLLHTVVPDPAVCRYSADTGANMATVRKLLRHDQLLRLDVSIFVLHLLITATFVAIPLALRESGLANDNHWQIYLGAIALSLFVSIPLIVVAERQRMREVLLLCGGGLLLTQLLFGWIPISVGWLFAGVTLFFSFLNALEALLPSLVSRLAPAAARGSASGIYSSSQFFGAFVGGAGGGWLLGEFGHAMLFSTLALICALWLLVLWGFRKPRALSSHRRTLSDAERARGDAIIGELGSLPGVEEVVLAIDEGVAYMKVDKTRFKPVAAAANDLPL